LRRRQRRKKRPEKKLPQAKLRRRKARQHGRKFPGLLRGLHSLGTRHPRRRKREIAVETADAEAEHDINRISVGYTTRIRIFTGLLDPSQST
jgi:hypothetical protein